MAKKDYTVPKWWYSDFLEENANKYYLVMSDDIDSFLSSLFLCQKFDGLEIGGFYDFKSLHISSTNVYGKQPIYVDIDVNNGLCFGNHTKRIKNIDSINFNNEIFQNNYTNKYAGSTLMTLHSIYHVDISSFDKKKLLFLICIDGWYTQFFRFRSAWDYWVEKMNFGLLTDILKDSTNDLFYKINDNYGLNKKITLNSEGYLETEIRLEQIQNDLGIDTILPTLKFDKLVSTFLTKKRRCY